MKQNKNVTLVLGILIAAVYTLMTAISLIKYPDAFSPASNWLSDLGNKIVSPAGSIFYNTGIYMTGSLLILFFISFGVHQLPEKRMQNIMLFLTQGIGVLGSLAMILSGVFSINHPQPHSLFSMLLRIGLGTAFGFSVAAFLYYKKFSRLTLAVGVVTTLTDLAVSMFFPDTHLLEWLVIFLFLLYCVLLGYGVNRLDKMDSSVLVKGHPSEQTGAGNEPS